MKPFLLQERLWYFFPMMNLIKYFNLNRTESLGHFSTRNIFYALLTPFWGRLHQCCRTRVDPKSTKKTDDLTIFFVLLRYVRVKSAPKTLMKLTPRGILHKLTYFYKAYKTMNYDFNLKRIYLLNPNLALK